MMTLVEFLQQEMRRLHRILERGVADLSEQEWHFLPPGYNNCIAFALWHEVRTEDNIVNFVLQDRKPTVWLEGGYDEKLGLHRTAQGTGMSVDEARGFRVRDFDLFMEYVRAAWASTEEYLSNPDQSALEKTVTIRPLGEMPAARGLAQVVMTHGFQHLGEIDVLRTIQGKPSAIGT
jgi:hypothetical protein